MVDEISQTRTRRVDEGKSPEVKISYILCEIHFINVFHQELSFYLINEKNIRDKAISDFFCVWLLHF